MRIVVRVAGVGWKIRDRAFAFPADCPLARHSMKFWWSRGGAFSPQR